MEIVGVDHTEDIERIKERVPHDYDKLLHEDFREIENLDKMRFLKNSILTPIYAFSFFFLIPLRALRRKIGQNRKSDFIFRKKSPVSEKISIDAHPAKIVEMHAPSKTEIVFNWSPIFLAIFGIHSLFQLGLNLNLLLQNLKIYTPLFASFLVIILTQIVLSWFLSLEERDQYMMEKILEENSEEDNGLVLVGDAHVPGMYSKLSIELDEKVNIHRFEDKGE